MDFTDWSKLTDNFQTHLLVLIDLMEASFQSCRLILDGIHKKIQLNEKFISRFTDSTVAPDTRSEVNLQLFNGHADLRLLNCNIAQHLLSDSVLISQRFLFILRRFKILLSLFNPILHVLHLLLTLLPFLARFLQQRVLKLNLQHATNMIKIIFFLYLYLIPLLILLPICLHSYSSFFTFLHPYSFSS